MSFQDTGILIGPTVHSQSQCQGLAHSKSSLNTGQVKSEGILCSSPSPTEKESRGAGVWAVGPGTSPMVVSEPSALISVSSLCAFHSRAGQQCVHGPAARPRLGEGGSTMCSVATQCGHWRQLPALSGFCPRWHVILIAVPRAFGGSVTVWGSWWHFGTQTPLSVPRRDTCVGG